MDDALPVLVEILNSRSEIQRSRPVDAWAELVETLLRNLRSLHSRRAYAMSLKAFFAWCQCPPDAVTKKDVVLYRDELRSAGAAASTINRHLAAIRVLYGAALEEGLVVRNPAAGVKTMETSSEGSTPALSVHELRDLLGAIDRTTLQGVRDYALILVLVGTGIRREEAARLQVSDLAQHLGHWTLRITRKGGKGQFVKVRADVYRAVQAWLTAAALSEGPLWRSLKRQGRKENMRYVLARPLTTDGILSILETRAKLAGITTHLTPHVLRATFITLTLDAGAPLHKVQYAAGHADPRTTERYHRSKMNLDDNAVDYLKL